MHSDLAGSVVECGGGEFRSDNQWIKGLISRQKDGARSRCLAVVTHVWP